MSARRRDLDLGIEFALLCYCREGHEGVTPNSISAYGTNRRYGHEKYRFDQHTTLVNDDREGIFAVVGQQIVPDSCGTL